MRNGRLVHDDLLAVRLHRTGEHGTETRPRLGAGNTHTAQPDPHAAQAYPHAAQAYPHAGPGRFWGKVKDSPPFSLGMIWGPPNTSVIHYNRVGDLHSLPEYHWHGSELITGNAFVLGGIVLLGILVVLAWIAPAARPATAAPGTTEEAKAAAAGGGLSALSPSRPS
jgi:hypothetical protein